jgi:hypothetical protein
VAKHGAEGSFVPAESVADFAVSKTPDIEISLTSLPWVDEPLVFLDTADLEQTRQELIASGATGLGEVADGSLARLGSAPITNGDAETGVVEVPGAKLAVVRLAERDNPRPWSGAGREDDHGRPGNPVLDRVGLVGIPRLETMRRFGDLATLRPISDLSGHHCHVT